MKLDDHHALKVYDIISMLIRYSFDQLNPLLSVKSMMNTVKNRHEFAKFFY